MFPPSPRAKFAVTDPSSFDGAMYVLQTNSRLWAWLFWRIVQRGKGEIIEFNLRT